MQDLIDALLAVLGLVDPEPEMGPIIEVGG